MPRPEIHALTEEHLGDAARLLAARHAWHRSVEPLLDERYERPDIAAAEVDEAFRAEGSAGSVAVSGGRLLGYVLGAPRPGAAWGPNVWVEAAGHALADDADPELVRDLYAHAASRWVDEGRTAHYVLVPSHDAPLVDAWFRLAFGQQHVHGVREVSSTRTPPTVDEVSIRRAEERDVRDLAELELVLDEHQMRSPVFGGFRPPPFDEALAEWEEQVKDVELASFVAEVDGVVVGSAVGCPLSKSGAHRGVAAPAAASLLAFAAVRADARGSGIGRALGETVLDWSAEAGYASVVVDWRATNLLSSRTWPQLGFRTTFLRLHRLVGF